MISVTGCTGREKSSQINRNKKGVIIGIVYTLILLVYDGKNESLLFIPEYFIIIKRAVCRSHKSFLSHFIFFFCTYTLSLPQKTKYSSSTRTIFHRMVNMLRVLWHSEVITHLSKISRRRLLSNNKKKVIA